MRSSNLLGQIEGMVAALGKLIAQHRVQVHAGHQRRVHRHCVHILQVQWQRPIPVVAWDAAKLLGQHGWVPLEVAEHWLLRHRAGEQGRRLGGDAAQKTENFAYLVNNEKIEAS
jgi:hypothetical protein